MGALSTIEKLGILADAAKYDASCASSGTAKKNSLAGLKRSGTNSSGFFHCFGLKCTGYTQSKSVVPFFNSTPRTVTSLNTL